MKNCKTRVVSILEQDKEDINEPTRAAALQDFSQIAGEYFELDGALDFQVKRVKNGYEVTIAFRAARIKNFTTLK